MTDKPFTFKKLFWAYTFAIIPFALLGGILSLFKILPVSFNGKDEYGWFGFIISVAGIPFFSTIMSCCNWIILNWGNLLYNEFLTWKNKK
jgi:hypothetical protein